VPPLINPEVWGVLTVAAEAGGEPMEGKVGVAEVIRNRMRRRYSSDGTVEGTVLRAKQFSCWDSQDIGRIRVARLDLSDPILRDSALAWEQAFRRHSNVANGAVLYHADYVSPSWAEKAIRLTQISRHIFYDDQAEPR